jgi:DNA-binding CsgD family transcriptional regulator
MSAALEIVGRDHELAELAAFVDAIPSGPSGLILVGEPGIGKTALWTAGLAAAREQGLVLSSRGARAEATLSLAGLSDLLAPVIDQVLPELPAPQARALEIALLRADAGQAPLEQRVLMTAVAAVIRVLASSAPLLVAIDDVQWLDVASAEILGFVLRRLSSEPVGVLASERMPADSEPSLDLAGALAPHPVRRLPVGALPVGAVGHILRSRVKAGLSWPTVRRIHEASQGNPLHALELARSLPPGGPGASEPLRVPPSLRQLVRNRLAVLPDETADVLLVASAAPRPSLALLTAATGSRDVERALGPATAGGIVVVEEDLLQFAHPLWAAAAYSSASASRRRSAHRRLAAASADTEERARHLALAANGPDEEVAAVLAAAARQARAKGATGSAAELADLAARLSPGGEIGFRRRIQAAEYLFQAGDAGQARRLLEELAAGAPDGPARGRALLALGQVRIYDLDTAPVLQILGDALGHATGDVLLQADIHLMMAWLCEYDLPAGLAHARAAESLLSGQDEPALLAAILNAELLFEALCGGGKRAGLAEQALALESRSPPPRVIDRPSFRIGALLWCEGDLDGARSGLLATLDAVAAEQDESSRHEVLSALFYTELLAGNWDAAERHVTDARVCVELAGLWDERASILARQAALDAVRGRLAEARAKAAEALEQSAGSPFRMLAPLPVLGFVALSEGRPAEAVGYLAQADALCERIGLGEPGRCPFHGDYAEALIATGDVDRAAEVLDRLESRGRKLGRPWALAVAARCRALLGIALGDADDATAAVEAAIGCHDGLPMPFELGRTHLVAGEIHRRLKHRKQAAEHLRRALEIFDGLGAPAWAERTRAELARVGLRTTSPAGLTETELQVAELVSTGLSNKEVAQRMFISLRTVESSLSRIYRKLGVRSRTELTRALVGGTAAVAIGPGPRTEARAE